MYGKLDSNGNLIVAPRMLMVDGNVVYNPSADLYESHGYMEIINTPFPVVDERELQEITEEGYTYLSHYEEQEGKIVLVWTKEEVQRDEIKEARQELAQIQKWFSDNDWKVNKIVIGEWETTDERWLEYLSERAVKRARQDELNGILLEQYQNN